MARSFEYRQWMTLIAEDLLLLLLDDESGKLTAADRVDAGLGGALLTELAMTGSIEVRRGSRLWSRARVHVVPEVHVDDPTLAEGAAVVAEKERAAQSLVTKLGKRAKSRLLDRLEQRGLLERKQDRILGLFPRIRWPAVDSAHEEQIRAELIRALEHGQAEQQRTSALIALLSAMGAAHKVLSVPGLSAGQVRKRAKEMAQGDWAAEAVKDAVEAAQSATLAAVGAAGAASSGGGS